MQSDKKDRYESLYNTLLESGELLFMFPSLEGDWEKDKKQFIQEQTKLEDFTTDKDIEDYDEY